MAFYDLNMNGKRIVNMHDPSDNQDVATKSYVDLHQANVLFSTGNSTPTIEGKAYYLDASENWELADYNNSANKLLALARGTISDVSGMWIGSNENDISLNVPGNIGSVLFLDLSGNLTTTKPAVDVRLVRPVGYKLSNNYIKYILSFNVSFPMIEASLLVAGGLIGYVTIVYVSASNVVIGLPTDDGDTIYIFQDTSGTAPGTMRTGTVTPNFVGDVEYLVVAGGAGGGGGDAEGSGGGGGGAGGYLTNYGGAGLSVLIAPTTLTVGGGGAGGSGASVGSSGSNSIFSTITAAGGGGGANNFTPGVAGGSGGGGGLRNNNPGGAGNTPSTTPSQGNNGGNALSTNIGSTGRGGGGGGSNTVGASGGASGDGGAGTSNLISGTTTTYAAGGGGGGFNFAGGAGTTGVSGNGASFGNTNTPKNGFPGTNGRGGGGGGATNGSLPAIGGAGGSGIVIVRFPSFF